MSEHTEDEHQTSLFRKLNYSKRAGNIFFHVNSSTESEDEKKVNFGTSSNVKVSFKDSSVEQVKALALRHCFVTMYFSLSS